MKYLFFLITVILLLNSCLSQKENNEFNNYQISESSEDNNVFPYYLLDEQPTFPGGKDTLKQFIYNNFKRNNAQMEFDGILCLCLFIDRNGQIYSFNILNETNVQLFDKTFDEFVKKMPRWKPGKFNGKPVKSVICLPILNILK